MSVLDTALLALNAPPAPVPAVQACRISGCTQNDACALPGFGTCWWVTPDLCSFCAEPAIVLELLALLRRRHEFDGVSPAVDLWIRRAESALTIKARSPADVFEV